jgi:hypothetical protein
MRDGAQALVIPCMMWPATVPAAGCAPTCSAQVVRLEPKVEDGEGHVADVNTAPGSTRLATGLAVWMSLGP